MGKEDNGFDLRAADYCEFCPDFEPDVQKVDVTVAMDVTPRVLTTIRCEKATMCEKVYERLRMKIECGGTK